MYKVVYLTLTVVLDIMRVGIIHVVCSPQPIRLCVLGPPAVGKSTISKLICQHYKLHHITLKATISETITQLVSSHTYLCDLLLLYKC